MKNKKAQFAEIDFFLAILLLGLGLIVITAPFIHVRDDVQADRISYDAVNMLSTLKFKDLNNNFQEDIISNFTAFNISYSVDDTLTSLVTKLLVKNESTNDGGIMNFARYIINTALEDVIPSRYKFEVSIQSGVSWYDIINISDSDKTDMASQSRTMLTGLEVQRPMTGFISSAFISEARKVDSVYNFIGGFVGQGNLSFKMFVDSDEINSFYLEGLFYDNFSISVNDEECANNVAYGFVNQTFDNCVEFINQGENSIGIDFLGDDLSKKYISGGSIRIDYNLTQLTSKSALLSSGKKYITGVDGVINIYDSFYVPGELKHVNIFLKHDINITLNESEGGSQNEVNLTMTIANETVYRTDEKGFVINESTNVVVGNYVNDTIPFRIGFDEFSAVIQDSSAVDVVLVTDLSGSMWNRGVSSMIDVEGFDLDICGWNGDEDWFSTYIVSGESRLFVQRIAMAICATNLLIEDLFDDENRDIRMAFVGFGTNVADSYMLNFTDDASDLLEFSNNMYSSAGGWTCISCGVAAGINLFTQSGDRQKIMMVMTDGEQNREYEENNPPPTSPIFRDYFSTGDSSDDEGHTNSFADYVKDNQSGTIYSINFAAPSGAENLLQDIASPNITNDEGSVDTFYLEGDDPQTILNIYQSIAQEIGISAGYVEQVINVTLDDFDVFESTLFNDSYIEYEYIPYEDPSLAGTIKLTLEKSFDSDDCSQNFVWDDYSDSRVSVGRGFLTSYSGNIWTSNARINDVSIFDIFSYSANLGTLGDPFMMGIRTSLLNTIENNVTIKLHDGEGVTSICDVNNKLIYDVHFPAFFSSDNVHEVSEGCEWDVEGVSNPILIPHDYSGNNGCEFYPDFFDSNIFDDKDSLQVLGHNILKGLTYNGELIIDLEKSSIDVSVLQVDDVPYLWGPALLGVTIWR